MTKVSLTKSEGWCPLWIAVMFVKLAMWGLGIHTAVQALR